MIGKQTAANKRVDEFYYYRSKLSAADKVIYDVIRGGLLRCEKKIDLTKYPRKGYNDILQAIRQDDPLCFHYENTNYRYSYYKESGKIVESWIEPVKMLSAAQYESLRKTLLTRADAILAQVRRPTQSETLLALHDHMIRTMQYREIGRESHNVCGPLLRSTSVCEGFAKYVKLMCDRLGIPCVVINGKGVDQSTKKRDNHSWNAIKADGVWYYYDFTFDLTITVSGKWPFPRYDYFRLTAAQMKPDHFDASGDPGVSKKEFDYFTEHGLVVANREELTRLLDAVGGKACMFRVSPAWRRFDAEKECNLYCNKLMESAVKSLKRGVHGNCVRSYNTAARVCAVRFEIT